jgi:hypothetical protein
MTTVQVVTRGGAFLIQETPSEAVFIPEEWTTNRSIIAKLCEDFLEKEIHLVCVR